MRASESVVVVIIVGVERSQCVEESANVASASQLGRSLSPVFCRLFVGWSVRSRRTPSASKGSYLVQHSSLVPLAPFCPASSRSVPHCPGLFSPSPASPSRSSPSKAPLHPIRRVVMTRTPARPCKPAVAAPAERFERVLESQIPFVVVGDDARASLSLARWRGGLMIFPLFRKRKEGDRAVCRGDTTRVRKEKGEAAPLLYRFWREASAWSAGSRAQ